MEQEQVPELEVLSDFDGFFSNLVKTWIKRHKGVFHYSKVVVTAGPYRSYDVQWDKTEEGVLKLDFYSPYRLGFHHLSQDEEQEMVNML